MPGEHPSKGQIVLSDPYEIVFYIFFTVLVAFGVICAIVDRMKK